MKRVKINVFTLSSFLLLLVVFFPLTIEWTKNKVNAENRLLLTQSLPPVPGVGPTVCVANCGGNDNPTVSGSNGNLGDFCRHESDCKSGLFCAATQACATGCNACNGSSVTTCQQEGAVSKCILKGGACSIAQGRFCCRGLICVSRVIGNGRVESRCRRSCRW